MESVFNSDSWNIKKRILESKNFDLLEASTTTQLEEVNLEYLNPIYYDTEVRIDIILDGEITLNLNDYNLTLNSSNKNTHCLVIKNWTLTCDNEKETINEQKINQLNVFFNTSTKISKFTIVQNMMIEGCNK